MAMDGIIALALAKNYCNKVGSTITGTSYDYNTGVLTFNTSDGDWTVTVNNGMTSAYKNTLDNVVYDPSNDILRVNGAEVLTNDNAATDDDIDSMFP